MNNYARKAWTVIGYALNGNAYCPNCTPDPYTQNKYGEIPAPIFASDEFYLIDPDTGEHTLYTCETCGAEIK